MGLNVYLSDNVPDDFTDLAKLNNKKQLAEHYGVSYAIIRKWEWLSNYKCSKRRSKRMTEQDKQIKELCKTKSYSAVGKLFGITKQRVEQIVNY